MEINDNDVRLANNTLKINNMRLQIEHNNKFEIESLEARIANVEDRISQHQQYLKVLNDELTKFKNINSNLECQIDMLANERNELLGNNK